MGSGVDALVQSAEKACDLARANWRTVTCEMDRRPSCECLDWQRWHPPRPFHARWHEPHALFFILLV